MPDSAVTPAPTTADLALIQRIIPHRYPFLMIDRVQDIVIDQSCVGIKNVTFNEPQFQGHFPGMPIFPGVLIIEALAQASGVLTQLSNNGPSVERPVYYLVKVDKARFSQIVVPGDQLVLHIDLKRTLKRMGLYDCRATVAGQEVACAEILCAERSR